VASNTEHLENTETSNTSKGQVVSHVASKYVNAYMKCVLALMTYLGKTSPVGFYYYHSGSSFRA